MTQHGYFTNGSSPVQITLPASSAVGDTFAVYSLNSNGWEILQQAGQNIMFGNQTTTTGTSGGLQSIYAGDAIELICSVADTTWNAFPVQGNITVDGVDTNNAINLSDVGIVSYDGVGDFFGRTITAGTGISVSDGNGVSGNPTISAATTVPILFTEDTGTAAPASNNLNILGTAAQGISTSGSGSTVTLTVANASATQKGVASFNSTEFTVTSGAVASNAITVSEGTGIVVTGSPVNLGGTVTIAASGSIPSTFTGNTGTATPSGNNLYILGDYSAADGVPVSTSASTDEVIVYVQTASAIASTDAADIGLAAFNDAQFSVDANGFVSLEGDSSVLTLTGNSGGAISPSSGNINTLGNGSITIAGSGSTLTTELTGLTNHAVLVGAGTTTITKVGPTATAGQVLQSNGSTTDPSFSTATYPSTTTVNQILYSSSANVVSGLSTVDNGVLITSASGVPSILTDGTTGQVLTATTGSPPTWQSVSSGGAITTIDGDSGSMTPTSGVVTISGGTTGLTTSASGSTMDLTGTLIVGNGGTGATTLTNHGVLVGAGTSAVSGITAGTNGQVLLGATSANPSFVTPTAGTGLTVTSNSTTLEYILSTPVTVPNGGTAASSFTANGAVISGSTSTSALSAVGLAANGDLLIGSASGAPAAATLTAGSGITITNGSNSITIATTGGAAFSSINNQVLTGSGTYTPTSGMVYCDVQIVGGGGGGGGVAATGGSTVACAGGGGAGGYARKIFSSSTIGSSKGYVAGAGGAGGIAGDNNGTAGTTSTFGSTLVSASGGAGGIGGNANGSSSSGGGAGGVGSSGDINSNGGTGRTGWGSSGGLIVLGGAGGDSFFGGGASDVASKTVTEPGLNATNYGGGGGGAANQNSFSAAAGGNGSAGVIIVTEYIS